MDQPRKLVLFFAVSLGFMLLWSNLVMPFFLPPKKPVDPAAVEQNAEDQDEDEAAGQDGDTAVAVKQTPDGDPAKAGDGSNDAPAAIAQAPNTVKEAEPSEVVLGSIDPKSGYYLNVTLTSLGAAIDSIELNDPKFLELDRSKQLMLIGDTPTNYRTLSTGVNVIDAELKKQDKTLADWNWDYVADETTTTAGGNSKVVFRVEIAGIEVRKTYSMSPVPANEKLSDAEARKSTLAGYLIDCELTFTNKSAATDQLIYQLQGPVGLRLENEVHARENRKLQVAFGGGKNAADDTQRASAVYNAVEDDEVEVWKSPFRYVGVDNTYFAALVIADPEVQTIGEIKPMVIDPNKKKPDYSDISLELTSLPVVVAPGKPVTHKFQMFAGPRRRQLLDQKPLEASKVLNLGWFGFVARGMLWLLGKFHSWGLPYGLAIICLTISVRGLMFPISRKQALGAQKMKDLQPEIQALKDKYKDDKEKIAKAQMELFAKHRYNPLAGCLPLFFQFPIFIGLYTALYQVVDLRLAKFLWIDNLAAPDATFKLPVELPFLGSDFSILPICTVFLFLAQQKLFMPPPTSEEQAMQHKMMNFMTIAFGFFFWHSPAGLCLYFIASSLWGITERKLLARTSDKKKELAAANPELAMAAPSGKSTVTVLAEKKTERKPGFLQRKLQELSDAAAAANETGTVRNDGDIRDKKNKNKNKKKKKR